MKKTVYAIEEKLPIYISNTVYDDHIDQMLDYKKSINHNKKLTCKWWQGLPENIFGNL